jgi:hypothetical protein
VRAALVSAARRPEIGIPLHIAKVVDDLRHEQAARCEQRDCTKANDY